jgi:hypothetical protein
MNTNLIILAGVLIFGASLQANTSYTYDFTTQNLNPGSANSGGSLSMASGALTVTETAYWANVNNSGSSDTGTSNTLAHTWRGAYGTNYGLGVCNPNEQTTCSAPQHQVDNLNGLDFIQFAFSSSVSLADIKIANFDNPSTGTTTKEDIDLSYAILTQAQENLLLTNSLSFSSITFHTINSLGTGYASGTTSYDDGVTGAYGQYILIGTAVTPYYGDTSTTATPDAFKIQALTVTTPEPASFLLIGSGLVAGAFLRRRRTALKTKALKANA